MHVCNRAIDTTATDTPTASYSVSDSLRVAQQCPPPLGPPAGGVSNAEDRSTVRYKGEKWPLVGLDLSKVKDGPVVDQGHGLPRLAEANRGPKLALVVLPK